MAKRHAGPVLSTVAKPIKTVGFFLIKTIGVPSFRLIFWVKRLIGRVARPTKHRVLALITNRYAAHVLVILLVFVVTWTNFNTRQVRAETFGQNSILYALVVGDDSLAVDVVEATDRVVTLGTSSKYLSDTVLDARSHIDLNYVDESYVTTEVGVPEEVDRVVPERTEIETYVVQEGDTLGGIAEKFGLNLSTILWGNNLTFRSTIRPGDEIQIMPVDGVLYKVRSGDTLSRIARRHNVTTAEILEANGIRATDTLSISRELMIPGGELPSTTAVSRRSSSVANLFSPPSRSAPSVGGWVWPTDWRVITQYYGWRHTGIDVDGDYSTVSYAARDGRVIYSGWRGGYGLTVEVDHGDGYMTRYAHHAKNYVGYGDIVSAGQAIAQTGTTGRSTGTHLHFEIIKNGRFQNPLDFVR